MKIALAVFVKTPGVSPTKTRLAQSIGEAQAKEFYRLSVKATESWMRSVSNSFSNVVPFWAVAEKKHLDNAIWDSFFSIEQGEGGLGERLHFVYDSLREDHDIVVFAGADSPHLTLEMFKAVVEPVVEEKADFSFGPTQDGGFYLFAGKSEVPELTWITTEYSLDTTFLSLKRKLEAIGKVHVGPESFDIDFLEDIKKLMRVGNQQSLSPEQRELIAWCGKLPPKV